MTACWASTSSLASSALAPPGPAWPGPAGSVAPLWLTPRGRQRGHGLPGRGAGHLVGVGSGVREHLGNGVELVLHLGELGLFLVPSPRRSGEQGPEQAGHNHQPASAPCGGANGERHLTSVAIGERRRASTAVGRPLSSLWLPLNWPSLRASRRGAWIRCLTPSLSPDTTRGQADVGQAGFLQAGLQPVELFGGQAVGDPCSASQVLGRLDDRYWIVLDPDPEVGRERPIAAQQVELVPVLEVEMGNAGRQGSPV